MPVQVSRKEEAEYVLGTVHSMKGQEAEDYVQLAEDFQLKHLQRGAWFRPEDRVSAPFKDKTNQEEEARLMYTAASKARLGLFCNVAICMDIMAIGKHEIGLQVRVIIV